MTVSSTQNRVSYAGNGATTAFSTSPVVFFAETDLLVYVITTATGAADLQSLTTDYTVSGGAGSTGTVTMLTAPASTQTLLIKRVLPLTQTSDYVNNDASDAEVVETNLDKLVMIAQQLATGEVSGGYGLRIPSVETPTDALTILPFDRASTVLGFDASKNLTTYDASSAVTESGNVTFLQSGTGPIAENLQSRGRWEMLITDFFSVADRAALIAGTTVDATAYLSLALTTGYRYIGWPNGNYKLTATQDLPSGHIRFVATGTGQPTITTTTNLAGGIFRQRNRGSLFEMDGLTFTGSSVAFYYDALDLPGGPTPFQTQYFEYSIRNCKFTQAATIEAIYLYGAREGNIINCYFETCKGIWTSYSIECHVISCTFKNTAQDIYSFTGSEGLKVIGGMSLGSTTGIRTSQNAGVQLIGILWDGSQPVLIQGSTEVAITGSYIASRTSNPAVECGIVNSVRCSHLSITGCPAIASNYNNASSYGMILANADDVVVSGNHIWNWQANGFQYTDVTGLICEGNVIKPKAATGTYSIACVGGDSATNKVRNNSLGKPMNGVSRDGTVSVDVGNVDAGEDNLQSYSLPANSITADGSGVKITAWGDYTNNANAKTIRLYFGSQEILALALTANQNGFWRIEATVTRTGASAQQYSSQIMQTGATAQFDVESGTATQTDTAAITIKCTGEATTTNDIVQDGLLVTFLN